MSAIKSEKLSLGILFIYCKVVMVTHGSMIWDVRFVFDRHEADINSVKIYQSCDHPTPLIKSPGT